MTAIAADGPRVAIAVRNPAGCDRAIVWTAPTAVAQSYVSKTSCAGVVFHGIAEIAIAGNRVEWLATAGGNLSAWQATGAAVQFSGFSRGPLFPARRPPNRPNRPGNRPPGQP